MEEEIRKKLKISIVANNDFITFSYNRKNRIMMLFNRLILFNLILSLMYFSPFLLLYHYASLDEAEKMKANMPLFFELFIFLFIFFFLLMVNVSFADDFKKVTINKITGKSFYYYGFYGKKHREIIIKGIFINENSTELRANTYKGQNSVGITFLCDGFMDISFSCFGPARSAKEKKLFGLTKILLHKMIEQTKINIPLTGI